MSFRLLQFPPQTSTRAVRMRAIPLRWIGLDNGLGDSGFLSSWLEDDTQANSTSEPRQINWGAISGLALSLAISASFWAGVGVLIAYIVR